MELRCTLHKNLLNACFMVEIRILIGLLHNITCFGHLILCESGDSEEHTDFAGASLGAEERRRIVQVDRLGTEVCPLDYSWGYLEQLGGSYLHKLAPCVKSESHLRNLCHLGRLCHIVGVTSLLMSFMLISSFPKLFSSYYVATSFELQEKTSVKLLCTYVWIEHKMIMRSRVYLLYVKR